MRYLSLIAVLALAHSVSAGGYRPAPPVQFRAAPAYNVQTFAAPTCEVPQQAPLQAPAYNSQTFQFRSTSTYSAPVQAPLLAPVPAYGYGYGGVRLRGTRLRVGVGGYGAAPLLAPAPYLPTVSVRQRGLLGRRLNVYVR